MIMERKHQMRSTKDGSLAYKPNGVNLTPEENDNDIVTKTAIKQNNKSITVHRSS